MRAIRHQIPQQLVKRSHHRTICSGGLGPASGNPLLGRGGPTATLSVQLFPRTGDTRPSRDGSLDVGSSSLQSLNLGQGLVRKVPPLPRIGSFMPLVDLGRPRGEDKTGHQGSGQLDREKMDVFLARVRFSFQWSSVKKSRGRSSFTASRGRFTGVDTRWHCTCE